MNEKGRKNDVGLLMFQCCFYSSSGSVELNRKALIRIQQLKGKKLRLPREEK